MEVRRPRSFEVTAFRDIHDSLLEVQYPLSFFERVVLQDDKFVCFVVDDPDRYGSFAAAISAQPRYNESLLSYLSSLVSNSRPGYIMTLGTMPAFRKQGLATKLIQHTCEALAKRFGCTCVELHCLESNHAARRLYRQCGFEEVRTVHNYYIFNNVPYNAILLRRNLVKLLPEDARASSFSWVYNTTVAVAASCWELLLSVFSADRRSAVNA